MSETTISAKEAIKELVPLGFNIITKSKTFFDNNKRPQTSLFPEYFFELPSENLALRNAYDKILSCFVEKDVMYTSVSEGHNGNVVTLNFKEQTETDPETDPEVFINRDAFEAALKSAKDRIKATKDKYAPATDAIKELGCTEGMFGDVYLPKLTITAERLQKIKELLRKLNEDKYIGDLCKINALNSSMCFSINDPDAFCIAVEEFSQSQAPAETGKKWQQKSKGESNPGKVVKS